MDDFMYYVLVITGISHIVQFGQGCGSKHKKSMHPLMDTLQKIERDFEPMIRKYVLRCKVFFTYNFCF